MIKYLSILSACLPLFLYSQNQPPVAVPDTMTTLSQDTVSMNVLLNDYDPEGDDFEIASIGWPRHGKRWVEDSVVYYIPDVYVGADSISYRISEIEDPFIMSEYVNIHLEVFENPNVPFAVNDTFTLTKMVPKVIDILANDGDPNGDDIRIARQFTSSYYELSPDSTYITATMGYFADEQVSFDYQNIERNTPERYLSNEAEVIINVLENPEVPLAVNDTFTAIGGILEIFDVLANDHVPLGDTIVFDALPQPEHGTYEIIDNKFHYSPNTSFAGKDFFQYRFRYKNKPWLYTPRNGHVTIYVTKNPDCPYGLPDQGSGMAGTNIAVDVLSNDHDPNGDAIEIKDAYCMWNLWCNIDHTYDSVILWQQPCHIGPDTAYYRIQKVKNPDYYSEWIPISYDIEWNPAYPRAYADSVTTTGGIETYIDFLSNDYIPDSIEIQYYQLHGDDMGEGTLLNDSIIRYRPYSRSSGRDTLVYQLSRIHTSPRFFALGEVYVDIVNNHSYDSLNINNINAGFNASGLQFSRIDELLNWGVYDRKHHFEVPKGSGNHTIYSNTLWIGGFDDIGQIYLAADIYRNNGTDFQPGPVDHLAGPYDTAYFRKWNRMWKLNKWEIQHHIHNWWKEGYEPIEPIASWPGNGEDEGVAEQLAPYFDRNGDGIYDPMDGDYPRIRGEQCIYFMTNDRKYHEVTQGAPLSVEIHGMAYAYDAPNDSLLNNTIFIHYDLINRSELTYYDTYFGFFTDFDLGYPWDDFIASHVMGNSFYVYNGEDIDGDGEPGTYGDYPPAQSHTILAGPFMDPDQEDNPDGGCDHSLLGLNFGNGIPDDERYGLTRFTYFNSSAGPQGYPYGFDFYKYMEGYWKDDSDVVFGGNGHFSTIGAVGPACRYMWPGDSDPYNWGTDCILPNGGFNQNGLYWTEEQTENNADDRKGLGVCGPFTFQPGEVQEVDMAYVFANSYYSADSSKKLLEARLMELRQRVLDGKIIIPNSELDIKEKPVEQASIDLYPNPAGSTIYIKQGKDLQNCEYFINNAMGTKVRSGKLEEEINISGLNPGFYILSIKTSNGIISNKFIKHK